MHVIMITIFFVSDCKMNKALIFAFALLSVVLADKYAIVFQGDTGYGNYSDSSNTCRAYDVRVRP